MLQEYYSTHEPFSSNPNGIPTIGTVTTGLMYLLMPLYFSILQRWPHLKGYSTWASLPVVAGSLIGASFAQTVVHLIACQGVLFALGGNLLFAPTVTYLDEWFMRRKGLAIGIMWCVITRMLKTTGQLSRNFRAGDGVGGVIMPLVLQELLSRYGFRITLRALACAMVLLMAPLLAFVKPRLPIPAASAPRRIDVRFLRSPLFWVLQTFNIVQGTGYFLPSNYLPTYAQSLGINSRLGSLTLVLVNLATVFGCILVGALVDRVEVTNVVLGISIGAGAAVLAVWGVSTTLPILCVFGLLYGLTAGSYSTAWTGMIKDVQRSSATADANVVFGFLAAGRGIGATVSGPLSELLIGSQDMRGGANFGYGSKFGVLIMFSGCTALVGGCSWIVRRAELI